MNKRLLIIVLFAVLLGFLLLRNRSEPESLVITEIPRSNEGVEPHLSNSPRQWTARSEDHLKFREKILKKREEARERALDEYRTPINFYGKVVDENEQPVEGAHVQFGWTDLSLPDGYSKGQTTSGPGGQFSLADVTGNNLSVRIGKDGYYTSKSNRLTFAYAGANVNFVPNREQPVVFYLRKHGEGEPLVAASGRIKVSLTGIPTEIDLLTGKQVPSGGHVRLTARSKPDRATREYDWDLTVVLPSGGVVETTEEFPFYAPADGYKSEVGIAMPASEPNIWHNMVERSFYFRLSNGHYGRLKIFFIAYNGVLRFESHINPSGSQNLELPSPP